jgi:hypothetical protein
MSTLRVDNLQNSSGTDLFLNSETASGYQKLPGGMIIQWGTCAAAANITFSIAFPTACLMCMLTTDSNNTSSASIANSYFHLSAVTTTGATRTNTTFAGKFIAFGY